MIAFQNPLSDDLPSLVEEYVQAHDLCKKQQERLRLHADRFADWHRRRKRPYRQDTDVARVSAWLSSLAEKYAPATVNGYRTSVLSLLRFATPDDAPLPRTDRVRRQREPEKINAAYTHDELQQLIEAAPEYWPITRRVYGQGKAYDVKPRHRPDGIPWSTWWEAFIRVGYESGQYLSDLRRIPWNHISSDGTATFVRHKTGKANTFRLSDEAIEAAKKLGHPKLLLPWGFDIRAYFAREWRKFARFAQVRDLEPKAIRRSAITYTYVAHGEDAARALAGHRSFATTSKHYMDWTIAKRPVVRPPNLGAF